MARTFVMKFIYLPVLIALRYVAYLLLTLSSMRIGSIRPLSRISSRCWTMYSSILSKTLQMKFPERATQLKESVRLDSEQWDSIPYYNAKAWLGNQNSQEKSTK